jgi:hypothetical protein
MYFYTHVLPRRIIAALKSWWTVEKTRAQITFNIDRKGRK